MPEQIIYYRNVCRTKYCFIGTPVINQLFSFVAHRQDNDFDTCGNHNKDMDKRLKQMGLCLFLFIFNTYPVNSQIVQDTVKGKIKTAERFRLETGEPSRFQLKTNLLYLAALMINLEGEYYIGKSFSVNVESQFAWWSIPKKHDYYRIFTFSPEIRYWIKPHKLLQGHFVGVFGGIGLYDLMAGPPRGIQGELAACGLTYGFNFRLTKKLRMEIAVSGGFMSTKYDQYYPDEGCYVYEMTKQKTYIGPTKLKVSLVWPLSCRFAKKRKDNARKREADMADNITPDDDGM